MSYYPAFLDLSGRLVLVVGGGRVAGRKVASLLEAGARVRLVSLALNPETAALAQDERVELHERAYAPQDFDGVSLCICATNQEALNRQVADEASKRGIFVNVVDVPPLCSFIVPASLRRGNLCLAISTGGDSPSSAALLRKKLEQEFGPEWGPYLKLMRAVRNHVIARGRTSDENKVLFSALAASDLREAVARRDTAQIERILQSVLGPEHDLAMLGLSPQDLLPEETS